MSAPETVEVPFKNVGGRQCLTRQQVIEEPWLGDFINKFAACFKYSFNHDVWFAEWAGQEQTNL